MQGPPPSTRADPRLARLVQSAVDVTHPFVLPCAGRLRIARGLRHRGLRSASYSTFPPRRSLPPRSGSRGAPPRRLRRVAAPEPGAMIRRSFSHAGRNVASIFGCSRCRLASKRPLINAFASDLLQESRSRRLVARVAHPVTAQIWRWRGSPQPLDEFGNHSPTLSPRPVPSQQARAQNTSARRRSSAKVIPCS